MISSRWFFLSCLFILSLILNWKFMIYFVVCDLGTHQIYKNVADVPIMQTNKKFMYFLYKIILNAFIPFLLLHQFLHRHLRHRSYFFFIVVSSLFVFWSMVNVKQSGAQCELNWIAFRISNRSNVYKFYRRKTKYWKFIHRSQSFVM